MFSLGALVKKRFVKLILFRRSTEFFNKTFQFFRSPRKFDVFFLLSFVLLFERLVCVCEIIQPVWFAVFFFGIMTS